MLDAWQWKIENIILRPKLWNFNFWERLNFQQVRTDFLPETPVSESDSDYTSFIRNEKSVFEGCNQRKKLFSKWTLSFYRMVEQVSFVAFDLRWVWSLTSTVSETSLWEEESVLRQQLKIFPAERRRIFVTAAESPAVAHRWHRQK